MTDDSIIRGVIAAVLARIDETLQPLRNLPTASKSEVDLAGYFMQLHHSQSMEAMRAHGYKTNDIVEIPEQILEALSESGINVDGATVNLDVREILLMYVLARQATSRPLNQEANSFAAPRFVSVSVLLKEIERVKAQAGLGEVWRNAIDTDVHKAISSLRKKLVRLGLNRSLIEGKRGSGYRLSTPPWNIIYRREADDSLTSENLRRGT